MEFVENKELFDLSKTISKDLIGSYKHPWEVLPNINAFIIKLGKELPKEEYNLTNGNVWIHKNVKLIGSSVIIGPTIICDSAEIGPNSYIRGNVIVGKYAKVGNSSEVKNSILFDEVKVQCFNYVGDSILGYHSHLSAGAITSNVKSDKSNVVIKINYEQVEINLKKVGSFLGDYSEVGCNAVLNPGTIVGKNTTIYPLSSVRGYVRNNSIFKNTNEIVAKIQ